MARAISKISNFCPRMKNSASESVEDMKIKIEKLKKRVKALESEIRSKDIIIEALVSTVKKGKRKFEQEYESIEKEAQENDVEKNNSKSKKFKKMSENLEFEKMKDSKNDAEIAQCLPGLEFTDTNDSPEKELIPQKLNVVNSSSLIAQIKEIFLPKSKLTEFKPNYTFKKFVEYCESSYEFSLTNKKISKTKNPLKLFIETNLERIVKYLIDNINTLNLNQICSTFFLINSEIDYSFKLIICHDIILELEDYTKLTFIASAIFNNQDLECDLFSQIIKKILFHQISIDYDFLKDSDINDYLDLISENMALSSPEVSLWESLSHFMVKHQFFDPDKLTIKSEAIEKGFMLRMTCHYIDWNYTYNTFVVMQLFPKIIADKSPIHVYYLGILALNGLRLFDKDESVLLIFEELKSILEWGDHCSVVAYLILKQVNGEMCKEWLDKNAEDLEKKGFDLGYLKNILLI